MGLDIINMFSGPRTTRAITELEELADAGFEKTDEGAYKDFTQLNEKGTTINENIIKLRSAMLNQSEQIRSTRRTINDLKLQKEELADRHPIFLKFGKAIPFATTAAAVFLGAPLLLLATAGSIALPRIRGIFNDDLKEYYNINKNIRDYKKIIKNLKRENKKLCVKIDLENKKEKAVESDLKAMSEEIHSKYTNLKDKVKAIQTCQIYHDYFQKATEDGLLPESFMTKLQKAEENMRSGENPIGDINATQFKKDLKNLRKSLIKARIKGTDINVPDYLQENRNDGVEHNQHRKTKKLMEKSLNQRFYLENGINANIFEQIVEESFSAKFGFNSKQTLAFIGLLSQMNIKSKDDAQIGFQDAVDKVSNPDVNYLASEETLVNLGAKKFADLIEQINNQSVNLKDLGSNLLYTSGFANRYLEEIANMQQNNRDQSTVENAKDQKNNDFQQSA